MYWFYTSLKKEVCLAISCVQTPDLATGDRLTAISPVLRKIASQRTCGGNDKGSVGTRGYPLESKTMRT